MKDKRIIPDDMKDRIIRRRELYDALLQENREIVEAMKDEGFSTGEVTDGYHTFDELYYHRMKLFAFACNTHKDKAWKSLLHDTGDMFEDMFIVGIETPEGQYTYHYDLEFWDEFDVKELERAPEFDGHQPSDIGRIDGLLK